MPASSKSASNHTKSSSGKVPPSSQPAQDYDRTHTSHSGSRNDSVQDKRHSYASKGEEQKPGPKSIPSARPVSASNPKPKKDNTTSSAKPPHGIPVIENGGGRVRDDMVRKKGDDPAYWKNSELSPEGKPKNYDARKERDTRYYLNSSN